MISGGVEVSLVGRRTSSKARLSHPPRLDPSGSAWGQPFCSPFQTSQGPPHARSLPLSTHSEGPWPVTVPAVPRAAAPCVAATSAAHNRHLSRTLPPPRGLPRGLWRSL